MEFTYFKGPITDMSNYLEGRKECSICHKVHDENFFISSSSKHEFLETDPRVGCYDCLRAGQFEFWHDTEFGLLNKDGLMNLYNHHMDNPPTLTAEVLDDLRHTPQIVSNQQELWLTHCNDFMVYKGTWEPADFQKNNQNGDGRDLFYKMTSNEMNHLWDDSLPVNKTSPHQWPATYYAFECRHCGELRGNWDSD